MPPLFDLITQSKVHGQIAAQLIVVVDEHLRVLLASARRGRVVRVPALYVAKKKVRIAESCALRCWRGLGIDAGKGEVAAVALPPLGHVGLVDFNFTAKAQNVFPDDQGCDIGRLENILHEDCLNVWAESVGSMCPHRR